MNFYAISALINFITAISLAIFVIYKDRKAKNLTFFIFCFFVAFWSFAYYLWQISTDSETALFWARALMAGAIFIPIAYLQFVYALLDILEKKKAFIFFSYLLFTIFFLANFTPYFVSHVEPILHFKFWPIPGIIFTPFLIIWFFYVIYSTYLLYKQYQTSTGIIKMQIKYVILGIIIGFTGGSVNYFLWYRIPIPPVTNISISFCLAIITYAIIKYRLMDIRVVIGRGSIYAFSFATVVALTFLLIFLNNLLANPLPLNILGPLIIIVSLLLFQPIFRMFEKLASRYFYYTFYSYQRVLTDLSKGLVRILDLEKLASLIVNTLVNTMKLDRAVILLREATSGDYKILKNIGFKEENGISLVKDNFLTQYLEKTQKPLVQEELSLIIRDTKDEKEKEKLEKLKANMVRIEANLCLPLLIEEKITGIIALGNKISGDPYSSQDMELLINLANQSSIALENARLYQQVEDLSQNLKQKVHQQTRKIQELLEMKSEFLKVVTHQLNTPASIIKGMLAMMVEGSIKGERLKEYLQKAYLSSERLVTILDDILVAQSLIGGGEVVKLSPCQIEEVVEKKISHFRPQAEMKNLKLFFEKPKNPLPLTLADSEMLERIIFKLIDNAILYTEKGEIKISLNSKKEKGQDFIVISVKDSGIGLDEKDKENLFKLFFRGKRATELHPNGTGLGLFIVEQFVKMHQGKIEVKSQGKNKGSEFVITLPVISEL